MRRVFLPLRKDEILSSKNIRNRLLKVLKFRWYLRIALSTNFIQMKGTNKLRHDAMYQEQFNSETIAISKLNRSHNCSFGTYLNQKFVNGRLWEEVEVRRTLKKEGKRSPPQPMRGRLREVTEECNHCVRKNGPKQRCQMGSNISYLSVVYR